MKKLTIIFLLAALLFSCSQQNKQAQSKTSSQVSESEWIPLFNGKDLENWAVHGKATWDVRNGIMTGKGGMGHIYTDASATDFEVKGTFRISDKGNSGLYFRANPPKENPDEWPVGYEAQIDHNQDTFTGWMWKSGSPPTAKAKAMITKDNEWFQMRVKMIGDKMQIWVNDQLMTEYTDADYKKGHFAIQGHNPGQTIQIKELSYRDLSK